MVNTQLIILCLASFGAGFVDSIVGGGGMIQLPALMMIFPDKAVVTLLGTNKLISVSGTAFSAYRFSKQIPFALKILIPGLLSAFIFSALGAYSVSVMNPQVLKPLIFVLMIGVFFFTLKNSSFGMEGKEFQSEPPLWKPLLIGTALGFYDGFFGPGTGSLLVISFIGLLSMTFVQGTAYAKAFNLMTNLAAILFFAWRGAIMYEVAVSMMVFNMLGAYFGVKLALLKGNHLVRILLRLIVFCFILKLGHELLAA